VSQGAQTVIKRNS